MGKAITFPREENYHGANVNEINIIVAIMRWLKVITKERGKLKIQGRCILDNISEHVLVFYKMNGWCFFQNEKYIK